MIARKTSYNAAGSSTTIIFCKCMRLYITGVCILCQILHSFSYYFFQTSLYKSKTLILKKQQYSWFPVFLTGLFRVQHLKISNSSNHLSCLCQRDCSRCLRVERLTNDITIAQETPVGTPFMSVQGAAANDGSSLHHAAALKSQMWLC